LLLRRLIAGDHLSEAESAELIGAAMDGSLTPVQLAGLLVAIASKGESVAEIAGAARAMRERSVPVEHGLEMVVDVVGTGGDAANTINISTMAALVVAAAGIPVAKHGNRAASSACGSADVLEAAGFPLELSPERSARLLERTHFAFLFAPRYHPAMRNVAPVRRELGVRTLFNVLGPLTNPARATHQVVGVSRPELLEPMGRVLQALGVRAGAVVHAQNGLDEVAGDVPTQIYAFDESGGRLWTLEPERVNVRTPLAQIVATSVDGCRAAFFGILGGERSPRSEVVALNAAVVLHAIGAEPSLESAMERARALLAQGSALQTFEAAKELSHG